MVVNESNGAKSHAKMKSPGRMWPDWYPVLATFRNSDTRKATRQLINTIIPYCGLWYLMIRSIQLDYPYTLTLILALPAAAFMVRLFILFHDCVHGSFFRRQNFNTFIGYFFNFLLGFNTINKKGVNNDSQYSVIKANYSNNLFRLFICGSIHKGCIYFRVGNS